jgi:hypothetical protein
MVRNTQNYLVSEAAFLAQLVSAAEWLSDYHGGSSVEDV